MNYDRVQRLKERYPAGTRIMLNSMHDPFAAIPPGTKGTVRLVDDAGQLHMKWDNGSALALIPGEDSFSVLPPELKMLKLYMPMTVDYYDYDSGKDITLPPFAASGYVDDICAALQQERMPEDDPRGLMCYYGQKDSMSEKVHSFNFTAEVRDDMLWGVAMCEITDDLSEDELSLLKEYVAGQASDGFGEGFEQRGLELPDGQEGYAHLWQDHNWDIQTEDERFGMAAPELTL